MLVNPSDGERRAVIMDFGLASFSQDEPAERSGSGFSGTIAYAAPERMTGGRATTASDVYALGLIAREMLTGRPPSLTGPPAPLPATIATRTARRWEQVIGRATHGDAGARFANGGALADAFRLLGREGRPSAARVRRFALGGTAAAIAAAIVWLAAPRTHFAPMATEAAPSRAPAVATAPATPIDGSPAPEAQTPSRDAPLPSNDAPRPERLRKRRRVGTPVATAEAVAPPPSTPAPVPAQPDDELVRELRRPPAEDDFALADPFQR